MMGALKDEYENASQLMDAMHRLHVVWDMLHPLPPLKRSDLVCLVTVQELAQQGHATGDPVTVGLLARALKQTPAGISQKVSVLEKQGYLRRVPNETDRRTACVQLTAKGARVCEDTLRSFLQQIDTALNDMGSEKTRQLVLLLNEASAMLEDMHKNAGTAPKRSDEDC